jgi:hypothetical protein
MGVMVDGVIMMDGVIAVAAVDGGRVPILASTLDRLTPPTDTMRILLHTGITDTLHTGTTSDTRTEDCLYTGLAFWVARRPRWLTTGNCLRLSRDRPELLSSQGEGALTA